MSATEQVTAPSTEREVGEYVNGLDSQARRELHAESAIDPEVTRERGYETITRPSTADQRPRQRLDALQIPKWATREDRLFPGLLIPVWGPDGRVVTHQFKPRVPASNRDGKPMKYASAKGQASRLDVHPRWTLGGDTMPAIKDATRPLFITEGIKKADSLTSRGYVTVGLNGIWNWRGQFGSLGDWEDVALKGRDIGIVYDADCVTNAQIGKAAKRLRKWLKYKGAERVWFFIPPMQFNGKPSKGIDDFFAAGATAEDFARLATAVMPEPPDSELGRFTDARLAQEYADEVLSDCFRYVTGVGWRRWTGSRWADCEPNVPREAIRCYILAQFEQAQSDKKEAQKAGDQKSVDKADARISGWYGAQSKSSMAAALDLAQGIPDLCAEVSDFDAHPELLNTPAGVVNLRTGEVMAPDPSLMMTRTTAVSYDPGAVDENFAALLTSIPADVVKWTQEEIGQSATGLHGRRATLLTGEGNNGKSKLVQVVLEALGSDLLDDAGYGKVVDNKLLLASKDRSGPAPEKMSLLGLRMAVMEETPEEAYLNANALKEIVDTPAVTARQLYQKQVTWRPSHTLWVATNHPPRISGTDTAIWRRLARVDFPHRFRYDGDGLGPWRPETDRPAIVGLGEALSTDHARRAALAWIVEGARLWFARTSHELPASVLDSVRAWRGETDDVMTFFAERLEPDPNSWIWAASYYTEIEAWIRDSGGASVKVPGRKTLRARTESHTGLGVKAAWQVVRKARPGHSKCPSLSPFAAEQAKWEPPGGQGFAVIGVRWRAAEA